MDTKCKRQARCINTQFSKLLINLLSLAQLHPSLQSIAHISAKDLSN